MHSSQMPSKLQHTLTDKHTHTPIRLVRFAPTNQNKKELKIKRRSRIVSHSFVCKRSLPLESSNFFEFSNFLLTGKLRPLRWLFTVSIVVLTPLATATPKSNKEQQYKVKTKTMWSKMKFYVLHLEKSSIAYNIYI